MKPSDVRELSALGQRYITSPSSRLPEAVTRAVHSMGFVAALVGQTEGEELEDAVSRRLAELESALRAAERDAELGGRGSGSFQAAERKELLDENELLKQKVAALVAELRDMSDRYFGQRPQTQRVAVAMKQPGSIEEMVFDADVYFGRKSGL